MRNKRYTKADKIENHNFTATISNLEDSTKYYVYAYAINDIDTAFSKTEGAYTTINGIGEVATWMWIVHSKSNFHLGKRES